MTAAADAPPTDGLAAPARTRDRLLPVIARLLLASASGGILFLSFAPRPLWWLAPLAFTGLGLALHGRKFLAAAGYGAAFGLTFFLLHIRWIQDFLGEDFGSAPWLGLSAVLAAYLALACGLMTLVARLPAAPVWMATVFLLQEFARSHWPANGFPWGRIGFSQPEGAYLPLASIGGAPLVGFAVIVTGLGLAALLIHLREHGITPSRAMITPIAATLLPPLAGLALWPAIGTEPQTGTRTVAVVQGNAPNSGLGLLGQRGTIRANHLAESERLAEAIHDGTVPTPDLVVWPETATDIRGDDPVIDAAVDALGVPTLIGALYQPEGSTLADNAVIAWQPGEGKGAHYAKQELVPFAEYVPMRAIASWFSPFVGNTKDMRGGTEPAVLDIAGTTVGTPICYEVAYDYPARDAIDAGAQLLVLPTNNAWYGEGEMTYQQLAMARVRAVEHGRAVVVAATSGVSAIVQPDGTVTKDTGMFTAASLVADVPLREQVTLSDRLGAWTEYTPVGVAAGAIVIGWVLRRRASAGARH